MTTKTKIKGMTFEKATKAIKPFVAGKGSAREVLKMINYTGEWLQGTDSHILVRIHKDYIEDLPTQDEFLYDIHNNRMSDKSLNYPITARMFPIYFQTEATFNIKELLAALKELKKHTVGAKNKNNVVTLTIKDNKTILNSISKEEEVMIKEVNGVVTGEDITISFNSSNVINALTKLKPLFSEKEITMKFTGRTSPFIISEENVYDVLIAPVRFY